MRSHLWNVSLGLIALAALAPAARADLFQEKIEPFAKKYCHSCHNKKQAKGELDLTRYGRDAEVAGDFRRWHGVVEFVRKGEMPPSDAPQPTLDERNSTVAAVEAILLVEAKKHAGDPGVILPRRLSIAEYDQSIRALTGVAIKATAEFPVDPAGGEGFDNTGEALGMTPNLLSKYLGAAQFVSEHLVLKRGGVAFAPYPVTSYNERKKLTEQAIIDFYRRHDVRLGAYLEAAWRHRHRSPADRALSVEAWATQRGLSGKYLALVAKTLDDAKTGSGLLERLGAMWERLPAPTNASDVPPALREVEAFVAFAQTRLNAREPNLINANAGNWPIAHLALRAKAAAERDQFDPAVFKAKVAIRFGRFPKSEMAADVTLHLRLEPAFDSKPGVVLLRSPLFAKSDNLPKTRKDFETQGAESLRSVLEREAPEIARRLGFGKHPSGAECDADSLAVAAPFTLEVPLSKATVARLAGKQLLVECELDAAASPESGVYVQHANGKRPDAKLGPSAELLLRPESALAKEVAASGQRFCAAFPSRFYYVDANRGLSAGFHLVEGFFRDDRPLVNKVLTDAQREELDGLWKELDFVTQSAETLLRGFVWFERAERHVLHDKRFDFLRSEDPLLVEEAMLARFERAYLEKLGVALVPGELRPERPSTQFDLIHGFFEKVRAGLAYHRQTLARVEAPALADVERLAQRAYCRPLSPSESASLRGLYQSLRKQGQSVEDALRGTFAAVLMSPHFFYRIPAAPAGAGVVALADDALARRLSYFLWSSLPDDELLADARAGALRDEKTLRAQVRRMTSDPRVESLAREFFGQWLRYRDFLAKDTIPAGVFPGYDASLRQAMFEEPTRLVTHLLRRDLSIDELLHSDATFVNEPLARFYGGAIETQYRSQRSEDVKRREASDPNADWRLVEGLRAQGRGGLFGMPVILAKNSAGQRTSPVKRGFWIVHHLLGQHFPPPPADVPELPKSEKESAKTIREMLAAHTTQRQCAMCHVHFDGLGLTLEGFDAVGRSRTKDLAGRAVQNVGVFPGGKHAQGVAGLIDYVETARRADFDKNLARKLLGYALGRSVLLSDQPLLRDVEKSLHADRRFSVLIEAIVLSPQFRMQRGRDFAATNPTR